MSGLKLAVLTDLASLEALAPEWEALAQEGGDGALFRGPSWLLPWLRAYGPALEARPEVVVLRDDGVLVGLAPFYAREVRVAPAVRARELRLLGDAGPRPPALDILARPGHEDRVGAALADWLTGERAQDWDVVDLQPLRDPSRVRAVLAERLDSAGRKVESQEAGTTLVVALQAASGGARESLPAVSPQLRVLAGAGAELDKGLAVLRRLSRLEWHAREETSPLADAEATRFLHEVTGALGPRGMVWLSRLDDEYGEAVAASLVVDDGARAVCVALAVDPERDAGRQLLASVALLAAERGRRALDVVVGAAVIEPPPLPVSTRRSLRLRAYGATPAGAVARTYVSLRRGAESARDVPGAAAAGARAAWAKIRGAATTVASYERLHLYRGELYATGIAAPAGLLFTEIEGADFEALPERERAILVERLDLDEANCREKWRRGDLVVLARLDGRPAGIAWCARAAVWVPELAREVRPGVAECYIHDVFVAPDARGKNIAPALLDEVARLLRKRDVYRAWALIHPANVASTRAFEKAAYAAVCDVIFARMAVVNRVVLRPADPEGKRLLGLG